MRKRCTKTNLFLVCFLVVVNDERNLAMESKGRNRPAKDFEQASKEVVDFAVKTNVTFIVEWSTLNIDDDHFSTFAFCFTGKIVGGRHSERRSKADVEFTFTRMIVSFLENEWIQVLSKVDDGVAEKTTTSNAVTTSNMFLITADTNIAMMRFATIFAFFDGGVAMEFADVVLEDS